MTLSDRVAELKARRMQAGAPEPTHVAMGFAEQGEMAVEGTRVARLEFASNTHYQGLTVIKVNSQNCLIVGTAMIE